MSEDKNVEELIRQVIVALVDEPDNVTIDSVDEGGTITINVHVDPADVGKVIGRQGRVIKSLRTIARAASTYAGGKHIEVEILD